MIEFSNKEIQHPFFAKIPALIATIAISISIVMGAYLPYKMLNMPLGFVIVDSLVYHLVYVVFALSAWYYVRYTWSIRLPLWKMVLIRFLVLVSILTIWASISYGILAIIFAGNPQYLELLDLTVLAHLAGGTPYFIVIILGYFLYIFMDDRRTRIDNETRLKDNLREAELDLLKSQINPHFLFNSLNSVSMLTLTDPEKAHTMIVSLSDYLRYSISGHSQSMATLQSELDNVHRYLEIEKIRFGKRLDLQFDIDENVLDTQVPVMLLQPLFENAIKHGVYESTRTIEIKSIIKALPDNTVEIDISNEYEVGRVTKKGSGLGLKNVRDRLRMAYGSGNSHLIVDKKPTSFQVRISIPRSSK